MAMTLIATNEESGEATSAFTSSIDNTYKLYIFKFYDCNPATDEVNFGFQGNASGQSGYNEVITSSSFRTFHSENNDTAVVSYVASGDQAQGTALQQLMYNVGNGADESIAGELYLFNPSNTTYVKHFYSRANAYHSGDANVDWFVGGYFNVTAAITNIEFKFSSGDMDGVIKMYGVGG